MQPDDNRQQAPIVVPPRQSTGFSVDSRSTGQQQAADYARGQIDAIYADNSLTQEEAPAPTPTTAQPISSTGNLQYDTQPGQADNPYARTRTDTHYAVQPKSWEKYHSAWQSYYQQYYERYYMGQVHETKKNLEQEHAKAVERSELEMTPDEALYDLRNDLRQKVKARAVTVRKSRHFIPVAAALSVMLVFLFLQYNRVIFSNVAAYVSPGDMDPSSLIVDPSANVTVGPEPLLIIPKITVQVPIVWDAVASDQNSLNAAMDNGVAWFNIPGANARPGEKGNFVVSGHSSNDWLDGGNYKFIFARLEQLTVGDVLYVNYQGKRYTYSITGTEVVKPTDVSALIGKSDKPHITLVTCTPLGTALNRLLVFADQVSPDPTVAAESTQPTNATEAAKMPSNSPTFLQRIFGGN